MLFNYLRKFAPDFTHKDVAREKAICKIVPEKPLDEKLLAYLMSQLTKLLESFLSVENLMEDEFEMSLSLLKKYHLIGLVQHKKSAESLVEKALGKNQHRNADFYQKQLIFRRLQYEQSDPNQRGYDGKLQETADALDLYFMVEKLRLASEMQNLNSMLNLQYQLPFAAQVAEWATGEEFDGHPAIQVYRQLFLLLQDANEPSGFEKAKKLISTHANCFEPHELKQLYTLLLNYCTRCINRFNDQQFWHEYLEINKLLLVNGLVFENGYLPPWRYTNLVTVGLRTGQTEWTSNFIHQYSKLLLPEYAENLFRYNLAQFHFHQKDFGKAQQELVHVEFTDVLFNLSVRSLLIKIYFETEQDELLFSYLEATRLFLLRNKLLDSRLKQQMKKFVEYCGKIMKAQADAGALQELLEKLPKAAEVLHRDWLAAKLAGQ
ncbi:MAG: hypothetical protein K9J37_22520 [Saprospiraceae bacterium]|nr:hypothetical protein [Saprospiraceae bacterium]MCF8252699.1 hypothetical protein [Saprospiraceae bacterium]MCF8282923.1 hypothetical protein [Bacteroidales bacterium]MCF8311653.1 hypothetical protein [Saprospiraceae bacterium]MCF8440994.1 hypothetical protein [Saprospiraceae bacterium]